MSAEIREETQPQPDASTSQVQAQRTRTYEGGPMISRDHCPKVIETAIHTEMATKNGSEEIEPECAVAGSSQSHHFASARASATSSTPPPIVLEATLNIPDGTPNDLEAIPTDPEATPIGFEATAIEATTTVPDPPTALHNAVDRLIAKHPKALSTISTVLTIVGGMIVFPGISEYARGTILAHPAVTIAGGIVVAVGGRIRHALNSAAALAAARASDQVPIEDVDDH